MNGLNYSKNKSDISLFKKYEIIGLLFMFINQIICMFYKILKLKFKNKIKY